MYHHSVLPENEQYEASEEALLSPEEAHRSNEPDYSEPDDVYIEIYLSYTRVKSSCWFTIHKLSSHLCSSNFSLIYMLIGRQML